MGIMARQIRPGQLQENVLYNISASYAVTASYAMNGGGGGGVPSGTVSGSAQITELGFVTSSATSSFVTNSQTASMSVATASYVTSAQSASYILAANIDQPFTTVSASGILNTGGGNFNIAGNGDDVVISTGTSAFVVESEAQFKDSINIDLASNQQLIVSGGRVDLRTALGVSGSFSGSFVGDGSGLTGITAEWDGSHLGNASITGSLILSASSGTTSNTLQIGKNGYEHFIFGKNADDSTFMNIYARPFTDPDLFQIAYSSNVANECELFLGAGKVAIGDIEGSSGNNTTLVINADAGYGDVGFQFTNHPITVLGSITSSGNISSSAASTASFGTYLGDGSQLSGINSSTSLTQSLFVSPSGNDGTAIVGDLHSPFQTILAATASANPGDTIIVYPGVYFPSAQIGKDYINYYFYPGAIVSGSIQLLSGTYEKLNIRGHGTFKTKYNGAPVGCTANGYFECDTVEFAGLQTSGYAGSPAFAQNVTADPKGILQLRGDYKYGLDNSARAGNSFNAAIRFSAGNIIANCNCFVSSSSNMMGIEIATTTTTDVIFNGDVYASNGRAVYTNDRAAHVTLTGRFETGNQATYEAIYIVPAYVGRYIVNGEIIGAIRIDAGETGQSGIQIDGFQECSSSPNASAIKIDGGYNTLNHTIRASEVIFDVNGGETHFYGAAYVSSDSTGKLFDISAGKFVWNGMNTSTAVRALSNVVSGGELVINGPLEHYGSSYPNNTECFALSGGTLEINNKVRYHQNTTGSGIVDMSGGYLKLNGAELVHHDGTGSYAPAINLNSGNYSGSILNNSYTNLNVFGNLGTFTNESIGGGTLFYNDKLY